MVVEHDHAKHPVVTDYEHVFLEEAMEGTSTMQRKITQTVLISYFDCGCNLLGHSHPSKTMAVMNPSA